MHAVQNLLLLTIIIKYIFLILNTIDCSKYYIV